MLLNRRLWRAATTILARRGAWPGPDPARRCDQVEDAEMSGTGGPPDFYHRSGGR